MKYTGKNPLDPSDRSNWTLDDGKPLSDDQWGKFQQWHKAGANPTAAPAAAAGGGDPPSSPSIFAGPAASLWAGVKGAGKEAIQSVESIPGIGSIPETKDSPSPVMSWARSQDPDHPWAEGAGRVAADVAPAALLPEADIYGMGARGLNAAGKLPWLAASQKAMKGADWLVNTGLKGAIGGASQSTSDRTRGAETGAGTAYATGMSRAAWDALPSKVKYALAFGGPSLAALAMMQSKQGGGHWFWPWYHAAEAAAPGVGAAVAGMARAPGVAGALGARAEDWMNSDDQGTGQSR